MPKRIVRLKVTNRAKGGRYGGVCLLCGRKVSPHVTHTCSKTV